MALLYEFLQKSLYFFRFFVRICNHALSTPLIIIPPLTTVQCTASARQKQLKTSRRWKEKTTIHNSTSLVPQQSCIKKHSVIIVHFSLFNFFFLSIDFIIFSYFQTCPGAPVEVRNIPNLCSIKSIVKFVHEIIICIIEMCSSKFWIYIGFIFIIFVDYWFSFDLLHAMFFILVYLIYMWLPVLISTSSTIGYSHMSVVALRGLRAVRGRLPTARE